MLELKTGDKVMKKYILFALALAALSCTREAAQDEPVVPQKEVTVSALLPDTRTALGDPEGSSYPNYWSEGDAICVNGVSSQPLGSEYAGASSASFVLAGIEAPYKAVYPASAVSSWSDSGAAVVIPSSQTWQSGTYDPAAFLMTGTSSGSTIAFSPEVALFKVVPNAAAGVKIASVKLTALGSGVKLSGTFTAGFSGLTPAQGAVEWVSVSSSEGVPAGEPIILAMAPADLTVDGLSIEITDTDGGRMTRTAVPTKAYAAGRMYKTVIDYVPETGGITCECVQPSTSSTLVFTWTEGNGAAADVANAYTATLYRDSACTTVDQSFDFPANLGAWDGKQPRYVFGGLQPSTDYWFKVKDTTNGLESVAVKATTGSFTVVEMPESITDTGVVLAEDFSEIRWDFDMIAKAVGFRPQSNSDFANTAVKTGENNSGNYIFNGYHRYNSGGEMTFKGQGTAVNNSRLKDWLTDTNVYLHPGYLKLGTASARGWILTPEFTVPEGKAATVTVSVTAARLNTSADSDWCLVVLTPELAKASPAAHTADFDWPDTADPELYQVLSFSNVDSWATKSVSGLVLRSGDRIAFGGRQGASASKGRVQISDMTVTVTAITGADVQPVTQVDGHVLYSNGTPAAGVSVSNGFDVAVTDSQGYYTLPDNSDVRYFYVSLPADAAILKNADGCPDFYKRKVKGCPTYDFTLEPQAVENKFLLFALADPQASDTKRGNQKILDVDRFISESVPAVNGRIAASSLPVYAVTLGDIIFSSGSRNSSGALSVMRDHCSKIDCPVFQTIGNHDYTYFHTGSGQELKTDATSSTLFLKAQRSFEDCFGPINYSFNRGDVHVVCMRNIIWKNSTESGSYHGGFADEQYSWLAADLANVPSGKTVILCVHIPVADCIGNENVDKVLSLLAGFAHAEIFSGHTHYMQKHTDVGGKGIYEHVHTSVCGAWWWSNMASDGSPNGYTVYEFNGGDIADSYFIGVNDGMNTREYQMRIYRGNLKYGGKYIYFQRPATEADLFINVFNADPYWTVQVYENDVLSGTAELMPEVTEYRSDAMYSTVTVGASTSQDWWSSGWHIGVMGLGFNDKNMNPYSWFMDTCYHMYKYTLKDPSATVKVVATDTYGNSYTCTEVIEQDNLYPGYMIKNI